MPGGFPVCRHPGKCSTETRLGCTHTHDIGWPVRPERYTWCISKSRARNESLSAHNTQNAAQGGTLLGSFSFHYHRQAASGRISKQKKKKDEEIWNKARTTTHHPPSLSLSLSLSLFLLVYYSCGKKQNKSNLITKRQVININDGLIYEPADEGVCVRFQSSPKSSLAYKKKIPLQHPTKQNKKNWMDLCKYIFSFSLFPPPYPPWCRPKCCRLPAKEPWKRFSVSFSPTRREIPRISVFN